MPTKISLWERSFGPDSENLPQKPGSSELTKECLRGRKSLQPKVEGKQPLDEEPWSYLIYETQFALAIF